MLHIFISVKKSNMLRIFRYIIFTMLIAIAASSCGKSIDRGFEVTSLEVVGMSGFTTLNIDIGIDNSSRFNIDVESADITLKQDSRVLLKGRLREGVTFKKDTHEKYNTAWSISSPSLLGGIGAVLNILKPEKGGDYTIDYTIKGRAGIYSRTIEANGVPLNDLIK